MTAKFEESSPSAVLTRPLPKAWLTLAILVGLCVLSLLDRQIIALMIKPIRADLGISDFEISLLQGLAFGLFYALCGLPIGLLVDRKPRRILIWAGVFIWSLATAASGLASTFTALLLARMAVGGAEAVLGPAAYSLIADIFPRQRLAFVLSIFSMGGTLGASAAFLFGGLLISQLDQVSVSLPHFGSLATWQLTFLTLGLPGLLIAFVIFLVPEPVRRGAMDAKSSGDWASFVSFMKKRGRLFNCLFVGCGLISMVGYGYLAWLPTYFIRVYGMSVLEVGTLMGVLVGGSGIVGGLLSGWVVDKMFARGIKDAHLLYWTVASVVVAVLSGLAFMMPNLVSFCIVLTALQMVLPFSGVAAAAVQITTPDRFRGRASAVYILVFNILGLGLGATAVAVFTDFVFRDDARVGDALMITSILLSLTACVIFAIGRKGMRNAVDETI